MLALARAGSVSEGDWLYADIQNSGRGRSGRTWSSPSGNVFVSGVVTLRPSDPEAPTLALVAAISVYDALRIWALDQPLNIKWPNDILVDGEKISGILLERTQDSVVVGVGVNLMFNETMVDRPATSLVKLGIAPPTASIFVEALLEIFKTWLARWRDEGLSPIRAAWLYRAYPVGTALSVRSSNDTRIEGLFDGLTEDCALRLRLADGTTRVIYAGDVFLI